MKQAIDVLRRIALMLALVAGTAGCVAVSHEVQYAPGYGYVVGVFEVLGLVGEGGERRVYVLFDTEEAAQRWIARVKEGDVSSGYMRISGYRRVVADSDPDYQKIFDLLYPPRPEIGRTIDNVTPPVPAGTPPQ
jgi:hypothetical protein